MGMLRYGVMVNGVLSLNLVLSVFGLYGVITVVSFEFRVLRRAGGRADGIPTGGLCVIPSYM